MWFWFALGSAVFAALVSILAKIGIEEVDSNLATAVRTIVVVIMARRSCSSSDIAGSFSFRFMDLYSRPLVLKNRFSGRPLILYQCFSSS